MGSPHPLLMPLLRGDDLPPETEITEEAIDSAEEHQVAALVGDVVTEAGYPIEHDLVARLTADTLAVEAEFAAAASTASRICHVASDLDIEIATFKGQAIAKRFYPIPNHRPSIDVDVFVGPLDTHRLPDLVTALGASADDAAAIDGMIHADRVFEASFELDGVLVDIHRDPMNMMILSPDEQDRWDRTTTFSLPDGTAARTLDLEDTVIQALLHLFRDNFADLLHVNDVRLMMARSPDWEVIDARATDGGYRDLIRFATWFVADQLAEDSPLPTEISRWRKLIIGGVWRPSLLLTAHNSHTHSLRRQFVLGALMDESPAAIGRSYLERLFPPRAVIDHRFEPDAGPYPVALARWRLAQRREAAAFKDAGYGDGE